MNTHNLSGLLCLIFLGGRTKHESEYEIVSICLVCGILANDSTSQKTVEVVFVSVASSVVKR